MAKILLIDDEPLVIKFFTKLLTGLGHEVQGESSGASGLEAAKDESIQLIISDLAMPGEPSGMELIEKIREARPNCPVIVVSGHPTSDRLALSKDLGVTEFLTKPFEMSFIRNVIEKIFEDEQKSDG